MTSKYRRISSQNGIAEKGNKPTGAGQRLSQIESQLDRWSSSVMGRDGLVNILLSPAVSTSSKPARFRLRRSGPEMRPYLPRFATAIRFLSLRAVSYSISFSLRSRASSLAVRNPACGCYQATQIRLVRFLEAFCQPWPTLPQELLFLWRRSLIEVSSYCQGFISFSRIGGLVSSPLIAS